MTQQTATSAPPAELVTINEAAALLKCSRDTVERRMKKPVEDGGLTRIETHGLVRLLKSEVLKDVPGEAA